MATLLAAGSVGSAQPAAQISIEPIVIAVELGSEPCASPSEIFDRIRRRTPRVRAAAVGTRARRLTVRFRRNAQIVGTLLVERLSGGMARREV